MYKVMTSIFAGVAILLFWKSADLWNMDLNLRQHDFALTFLGWEVKSNVPAEEIPVYARTFFVFGSLAVITAFISLFRRTSHEIESSADREA